MKNILVTGGCGFIGSNFIRFMLDNSSYSLFNLDKLTYAGNLKNLKDIKSDKYVFFKGDICDFKFVDNLVVKHKIDTIVHFAAETHVDKSIENPDIFIRTNVLGTHALLSITKKHNLRFHHVSTDEVFGDLKLNDPKFNELTKYNPSSPYSASKASSDHLVMAYIHTFGIRATISNCSNNYGKYQYPEKIIPLFITNLIDNQKIPIYGKGDNIRNWLHVDDHSKAVKLILEKSKLGETYCIGSNDEISNLELTKLILREMESSEDMILFVKDRPGHDFRYAIDFSKIKKELGWEPKINFKEGIKSVISWYKNSEWWWRSLK